MKRVNIKWIMLPLSVFYINIAEYRNYIELPDITFDNENWMNMLFKILFFFYKNKICTQRHMFLII